jgi:RNA polymerase sigma factor (sigma-70 family)
MKIFAFGKVMPDRADSTSSTLLGQLAASPPDEAAWSQFVDRYGPRIFQWCRAWGLQEADILDVSQAVLTKLSVRLRHFDYDPSRSFRGWLRSLVRNTVQDAFAARGPIAGTGMTDTHEQLASMEARDDLVRRLEEEFDLELLEVVTLIVRRRITARTWEAYRLTACEGRPAAEVAKTLGMRVGAVYQARSGVMRMLQEEIRKLQNDASQDHPY